MKQIQIVNLRPEGFVFAESWREAIHSLRYGLLELGFDVAVRENQILPGVTPVVFGSHHLGPGEERQLPAEAIIYNLEQLREGYPWFQDSYLSLLRRFRVWDFNLDNVEFLRREGIAPAARYVPVGYMPQLERVPWAEHDVDILFYGIVTERRKAILEALARLNLKVTVLSGVFGEERDSWIARARIVLNICQAENGLFDSLRTLHLLANRKALISEAAACTGLDNELAAGMVTVPYDELVETCLRFLAEPQRREALAAQGYATVTAARLRMSGILRDIPELAGGDSSGVPADVPAPPGFRQQLRLQLEGRSPDFRPYAGKPAIKLPLHRIAFYLPQFHRCPENDGFWGQGFTEWHHVTRALPQFAGHRQPRVPADLGYYDLSNPDVIARQVDMAKNYGLTGFMFFFYWFEGKPVLELPVTNYRGLGRKDFRYFLMWANENWTRRWDGADSEVLLRQDYGAASMRAMIKHLAGHFRDETYLTVDGRPLLAVYRADQIPDLTRFHRDWHDVCRAEGLEPPYFLMAMSFAQHDPGAFGFDAALEYPPHFSGVGNGTTAPQQLLASVQPFDATFSGQVFSYDRLVEAQAAVNASAFRRYRTAFPDWDNTPRRRNGRSWTFAGATPARFADWVRGNCRAELARHDALRMICVNAWNEWGEGAHLEPDTYMGCAYLEAFHQALADCAET